MEISEAFLVQHVHTFEDQSECVKTIGVYSTRDYANRAVDRLKLQPGFRDSPTGFVVDCYRLDEDCWREGYVTTADVDSMSLITDLDRSGDVE